MKSFNEIKHSPEFMAKIEACHSADELVKLAADNDVELSLEEAEKYFTKVTQMMINDDELDKIAGGATRQNDYTVPDPEDK